MIYLNIYRVLQRTAISTNIKVRSMTLQGSILAYHQLKTKDILITLHCFDQVGKLSC